MRSPSSPSAGRESRASASTHPAHTTLAARRRQAWCCQPGLVPTQLEAWRLQAALRCKGLVTEGASTPWLPTCFAAVTLQRLLRLLILIHLQGAHGQGRRQAQRSSIPTAQQSCRLMRRRLAGSSAAIRVLLLQGTARLGAHQLPAPPAHLQQLLLHLPRGGRCCCRCVCRCSCSSSRLLCCCFWRGRLQGRLAGCSRRLHGRGSRCQASLLLQGGRRLSSFCHGGIGHAGHSGRLWRRCRCWLGCRWLHGSCRRLTGGCGCHRGGLGVADAGPLHRRLLVACQAGRACTVGCCRAILCSSCLISRPSRLRGRSLARPRRHKFRQRTLLQGCCSPLLRLVHRICSRSRYRSWREGGRRCAERGLASILACSQMGEGRRRRRCACWHLGRGRLRCSRLGGRC